MLFHKFPLAGQARDLPLDFAFPFSTTSTPMKRTHALVSPCLFA